MSVGFVNPPTERFQGTNEEHRVQTFSVKTSARVEMIDITAEVAGAVREEKVREGMAVVFVPHTTAGVTINENADPDVVRDIVAETNKVIPFDDGYAHGEGNSAATSSRACSGRRSRSSCRTGGRCWERGRRFISASSTDRDDGRSTWRRGKGSQA